jgi:hypothetical protein
MEPDQPQKEEGEGAKDAGAYEIYPKFNRAASGAARQRGRVVEHGRRQAARVAFEGAPEIAICAGCGIAFKVRAPNRGYCQACFDGAIAALLLRQVSALLRGRR